MIVKSQIIRVFKALSLCLLFASSPVLAQNNLLPTPVSNFNIGTVGNGHSGNNLSNAGVTTHYTYKKTENSLQSNDTGPGCYAVGDNANWYNHQINWSGIEQGYFSMGDHTPGTGNYMIVNGAPNSNAKVWEYTVDVAPGVIYDFEAWVTCLFIRIAGFPSLDTRPRLRLLINDTLVSDNSFTVPWVNGGEWTSWTESWTAGNNTTSAKITIIDECTERDGNDFGLDDIVFKMKEGYSLTANSFTFPYCGETAPIEIELQQNNHYTMGCPPGGNSAPPMEIKIRKGNYDGWQTHINLDHGTATVGSDNRITYTPNANYYGQDSFQYKISRFGLESQATITVIVGNIPSNCTPQELPANNLLCISDISSFNPSATWEENGSNITESGWEFRKSNMDEDAWLDAGMFQSWVINQPVYGGLGEYSIRFYAKNSCTGNEYVYSDPYNFTICDVPQVTLPTVSTICTGSAEPEGVSVNWNFNTGNKTWQYKLGNESWESFNWGEIALQPGDQLRYRVTWDYCGGSPLISDVINVVSGPQFNSTIPVSFESGYCPGSVVSLPSIQSSWYDDYGMGVTPGWYYVNYDPTGSPSYEPINGSSITLGYESVSVTPCLENSECGFTPFFPAFELVVYEAPSIQGLDELPDSLGPVCSGTALSSILPELSPGGHYLVNGYGWEISSGQSQTGFSSNLPTQLSPEYNGRWLRYHVEKVCTDHNDFFSDPIRVWVGDKPTLHPSPVVFPDQICSGTSVASLAPDVYVEDWHLFDSIFAGWEVSCNNGSSWEDLYEFNESHDGCQVRYRATNQCGDELLLVGVVTVTEGPSFNNSGPLGFSDYYCDGSVLEVDDFPMPPVYDPHNFDVDPYWAYIDGTEYREIPFPLQLNEDWNGRQITYVLNSNCGGEIPYPTPYTLTVKGQPEVEITLNGSTTFCVDTSIPSNVEIDWHLCTPNTQASSWLYAPVDQPDNYSILYPMEGISIAGEYNIKYLAVANECGFEAYSNSIRVTVEYAPEFENSGQPFMLDRFCEGRELELPLAPSVTGHVDNALWRISVGTDPDGPYESVEPNYLNYYLTLDDNGRWLQYYAIGCDTPIHYEEEIHVDGKPLEEYEILDICKGQTISYHRVYTNGYPVTDWEWKWENDLGEVQVFDPDVYTFDTEGHYSITYRVHNDCGWSVFQGPLSLTVTAGPEFDNNNSTLPPETLYVCEGKTVEEFLLAHNITPPPLVDPSISPDTLGWFIGDQPVELSTVITEAYHGDELRYGVRGDCSSVPVYSRGVPLHVYGRPEVTQMPSIDWEFCDGADASHLPDPLINDHNGGEYVTGHWQIQSQDGTWDDVPTTWSADNHNGAQIRYHLEHTFCPDLGNDSGEITISVFSAPIINDDDLPSNTMISLCFGGALGIDEPEVLPGTDVKGWQVSANGTDWGTALEGHFFNPSHVDDYFNGKYLRYHAESAQCPDLEDNSLVYTIQLMDSPSINDEDWPTQVSYCLGGSLGIPPDGLSGEWQVSVDGMNWGTALEGHVFNPNHIDDFFDGRFLRYFVHTSCGEDYSKVMKLIAKDSEQMGLISGDAYVYVASSLISGIYRYEIDMEELTDPVAWSLSNTNWQIVEQGYNYCRVLVTMPGTATLTAHFNVEECGEMERSFEINASFYGVDDHQGVDVLVFPNPTRNTVTIEAEGIEAFRLTNMMGQVLEMRECDGSDSVVLNLSGYTPSVYLLEVKTVKGVAKKRLILYR